MTKGKQKANSFVAEKRALCEKMTSLLKGKIYKTRLTGNACRDACSKLASHVMSEARKSCSVAHCTACSLALVFIVKAVSNNLENSVAVAQEIYPSAVKEWSSRKTTKLTSIIFDDLTTRYPGVARTVLLNPLRISAIEAFIFPEIGVV